MCALLSASLSGCNNQETQPSKEYLELIEIQYIEANVSLYKQAEGLITRDFSGEIDLSGLNSIEPEMFEFLVANNIELYEDTAVFLYNKKTLGYDRYGDKRDTLIFTNKGDDLLKAIKEGNIYRFFEGGYGLIVRNSAEGTFSSMKIFGGFDVQAVLDTLRSDSLFVVPLEFHYHEWEPD